MDDTAVGTESAPAERPVSDLVAEVGSQVSALLGKEVELAVAELKDEVKQAAKAGGMLTGAALSGYLALLFGSLAAAWFLDRKLPRFLAFGLVSLLHGIAAAALLKLGHQEMMQVDPVPTQTIETLKENVEFARSQAAFG